jgi:hypothetical protein
MKTCVFARILRTLLVAALFLGPVLSFAVPMAMAMQDAPGKNTISADSGHSAKLGCTGCPGQGKGMAMVAHNCDAACPSPIVLPVQPASPEPRPPLAWLIFSIPDHPTIAGRIEPPPPKFSTRT